MISPLLLEQSPDGVRPMFAEVGADPRSGAGFALPIGSIVRFGTNYFAKIDASATGWKLLTIQTSTPGSNVTSIAFPVLGQTDGAWLLRYHIIAPAAGSNYFLRANAGALTGSSRRLNLDAGGVATAASVGDFQFTSVGANAVVTGDCFITGRTGRARRALARNFWFAADRNIEFNHGELTGDTATAITELDVVASAASGILTGSKFELIPLGSLIL